MKQTAVEWLIQEINKINVSTEARLFINKLKEQAKAMEKEQIMQAFETAEKDCGRDFLHGDLYYNETFKLE